MQILHHKLPGKIYCTLLEIVTEREVAQHLKEGMVPGIVAYIFQVAVLTAGPETFLNARGAKIGKFAASRPKIFEGHHSRGSEEQGGVFRRNQRNSRYHGMSLSREKIQKLLPDLKTLHMNLTSSKPKGLPYICRARL